MQILTAWDWYLKRDNNVLLGPVRTEGTEFIVCRDSTRVLQKRLFHLAVDGLINNTPVRWRDLVFLTDLFGANDNKNPPTSLKFSHIIFRCIKDSKTWEHNVQKWIKTTLKSQSKRSHMKPHTDLQSLCKTLCNIQLQRSRTVSVCHSTVLASLEQTVYPYFAKHLWFSQVY